MELELLLSAQSWSQTESERMAECRLGNLTSCNRPVSHCRCQGTRWSISIQKSFECQLKEVNISPGCVLKLVSVGKRRQVWAPGDHRRYWGGGVVALEISDIFVSLIQSWHVLFCLVFNVLLRAVQMLTSLMALYLGGTWVFNSWPLCNYNRDCCAGWKTCFRKVAGTKIFLRWLPPRPM